MAGGGGSDGEFGFQIAPMLDILFVLLLFFMVSAGAQKHEAGLTTQLPGSGGPTSSIPVQVGIDEDGTVNISGAPTGDAPTDHALPALVQRLDAIVQANPTQPIVVTPTRSTHHQRVVDVLNACAAAKVKNLAFGTPPD
jgi:biopolymer transport protein ExbD